MENKGNTQLDRIQNGLYQVAGLTLIIGLFFGLALLHAELGGFQTFSGALVGIFWLVLLFSPIIDKLIGGIEKLAESEWFQRFRRIARIGKIGYRVALLIGALLTFLYTPTRKGVVNIIQNTYSVIFG